MLTVSLLTLALQLHNALAAPQATDPIPQSLAITLPSTAPSTSVSPNPNLVAFSIESDRWPDWAALAPSYTQRNNFVYNVLNELGEKVGSAPSFRIGADSEDRSLLDPSVDVEVATFGPPTASMPYPEAGSFNISSAFYALSRFLPRGTKITWGLNFGVGNVTSAIQEALAIRSVFGPDNDVQKSGVMLDVLELGNEADNYGWTGHRNSTTWNIAAYVPQWADFIQQIVTATGLKVGQKPGIQALAFAGSDHGNGWFSPQQAIADGLMETAVADYITVVSQHKYSGGCCAALIEDLMSKSFIRANLTAFIPDIAVVKAQGLPYVFGEGSSYFNHGVPLVSDAAGSAIWIADYILFGATLGIEQMFFHQGVGYKYNLIQPVALDISSEDGTPMNPPQAAHVAPSYYGALVVNEFLGTSSKRALVELDTSSSNSISGYAIYDGAGGKIKRALFINHDAFHATSGTRSSVSLSLGGLGNKSVQVKRLNLPTSDVLQGLTWAGQTYDTANGKPRGSVTSTKVKLEDGLVISASEIVMVTF